jgi:biopolymer transport protein ExbD
VDSANVESELAKRVANLPDATIVLRADRELSLQNIVDLLEIGNKLKVRMVLATTTK